MEEWAKRCRNRGRLRAGVLQLGMAAWPVIAAWYGAASLAAMLLYALDKGRARHGGRRVPEANLHWVEFAGGWPGALAARLLLRHKTRKARFLLVSWAIIAAHCAAWVGWWLWGRALL